MAEFRSNRSERRDLHTTEEEAKCQAVFRTTDYVFDKGKNPKRVLGTCEWFLYHLKYLSWLNDAETNWLWVTANPGCGKSVLAKHLVDTLDETKIKRESTICYFFFKGDSERNRSANHCLCTLLHQVFKQDPSLLKHATHQYQANGAMWPQLYDSL